jgi:hypothetical protein
VRFAAAEKPLITHPSRVLFGLPRPQVTLRMRSMPRAFTIADEVLQFEAQGLDLTSVLAYL